jgi:SRSO17 transposase
VAVTTAPASVVAEQQLVFDGVEAALMDIFGRLAPRFGRREVRRHAEDYLRGLLGDLPRKNGRQLASYAGRTSADGLQRLLTTAVWNADDAQADVRDYVLDHLGAPDGVLVASEVGFAKKGDKSVGVAEQWNAVAGKIENCQLGMFLSYASDRGSALIDRALYLPQQWTQDPLRRRSAGIPPDVGYLSKDVLIRMMLDRFSQSGAPFRWLVGDKSRNSPVLQEYCEQRRIGHVLRLETPEAVTCGGWVGAAHEFARHIPAHAFERRIYGDVSPGRQYDWAVVKIGTGAPGFHRSLLVRRSVTEPSDVLFSCHAPANATLAELVRVAERRYTTHECVAESRRRSGLDDYEVRKYLAWHRHMTLSLSVAALLRATRSIPMLGILPLAGRMRVAGPRS